MHPIQVFVCGERFRRDDGVAAAAARLLSDDVLALADVREMAELAVEALLTTPRDAAVVVVDAVAGIEPGRIRRLPLDQLARAAEPGPRAAEPGPWAADLERAGPETTSSHGIALSSVLALAAELRGMPVHGTFIGIGGADFGYGEELSPVVAAELPALADAIALQVRRLAAGKGVGDGAGAAGKGRIGP